MTKKCPYDKRGECQALLCYTSEPCGSRDKDGNPQYRLIKEVKG